jgi:translation initiation factor IF-3
MCIFKKFDICILIMILLIKLQVEEDFSPICQWLWVMDIVLFILSGHNCDTLIFLLIFRRCYIITELMINEQIRDKEVRLIDADGTQLGIVSNKDALNLADEKNLDLVKISPTAKPPVCKIMDYSKFKFDSTKKEKEARKKQKTVDIKELRLSPNIDTHDINVKIKKASEFLQKGDKVKVTVRFRGRELGNTNVAYKILHEFAENVSEYGVVDKPPKMEARSMAMFLSPKDTK